MNSLILQITARYLAPVILMASLVLLFRGHNYPGGGFIGGLLAASAFSLHALASGSEKAQRLLRVDPRSLLATGLLLAAVSTLPALLSGETWFTGQWMTVPLPLLGDFPLGTPLLFDVGVYVAVIGFTLTIVFVLTARDTEEDIR
ncbi:MAG: Na+/H+ antiporter subunit B [Bacteroidota bacterium]|nr:Na+/H+ antiporter subunit B [Bacteroidota bacterium]